MIKAIVAMLVLASCVVESDPELTNETSQMTCALVDGQWEGCNGGGGGGGGGGGDGGGGDGSGNHLYCEFQECIPGTDADIWCTFACCQSNGVCNSPSRCTSDGHGTSY